MIRIPEDYAVIDLETTGLDPGSDKIIEIGVKRVHHGCPHPPEAVLVHWPKLVLSQFITNLTSITDEDLKQNGLPIQEALSWLIDRTHAWPLVGHNIIKFDRLFLDKALSDYRPGFGCFRHFYAYIDTAGLFKALVTGDHRLEGESSSDWMLRVLDTKYYGARFSLKTACEHFDISTDLPAHRAIGDVERCYQLLQHLAEAKDV